MNETGANVVGLPAAVPGLTLLGTSAEPGYTCRRSGADRSSGLKVEARMKTLAQAEAKDVDILASLYYGCHG
jgi:hypothetical protein